MTRRAAAVAFAILAGATVPPATAQPRVVVRDPGPGDPGRILLTALAAPHVLLPPARDTALVRRDSVVPQTLLALGRHVVVEGTVRGDVVVVAADLVLHPGARIGGRAIAIGGGVYNSTLAVVAGGRTAYREVTFDIAPITGGYALDYRALTQRTAQRFSLPFLYGVRAPTYDRVNGLSLPYGPLIAFDTGDVEFEPTATYRSHIGRLDPALRFTAQRGRRNRFEAFAGRATFSNDRWLHGDLVNSVNSLFVGQDTRNYYRADRAEATAHRLVEAAGGQVEPYLGARWERARSVGSATVPGSVPWSMFGRHDSTHMARPNPPVTGGDITSLLGGLRADWQAGGLTANGQLDLEGAVAAPVNGRFAQATFDGGVAFPTFGTQTFQIETHVVFTGGQDTPSQRFAYLGGPGTISTIRALELGGDQLLFVESRYNVPLSRPRIPLAGPPVVTLRHVLGSAGVGSLPPLEQNIALRLTVAVIRFEVVADPARDVVKTGVALSFSR